MMNVEWRMLNFELSIQHSPFNIHIQPSYVIHPPYPVDALFGASVTPVSPYDLP